MSRKYDNSGILGRNDRKEKESHPTHSGQCTIDGKEYWLSAWVKEGERGKFFSLAFKPKDNGNAVAKPKQQKTVFEEDFDDSIPFAWVFTGLFAGLLTLGAYLSQAAMYA